MNGFQDTNSMLAAMASSFIVHRSSIPVAAAGFVTLGFALAGLAAAAIPIIIHILNRRRFKIVTWAAMDFLLNAMKKNRRRLKFEQWLLLATRCLLLALLGLALARPLGCENTSLAGLGGTRSAMHVFVIDNSYSMSYDTGRPSAPSHLAQAKIVAKQAIDRLKGDGESVVIITAARPTVAIGNGKPTYNLEAAKAAIDRIEQSAGGTDLNGALQAALQIGREETKQPLKFLYLLTDATKSAWEGPNASALKQTGADLAALYKVRSFNLGKGQQTNVAAIDITPGSNLVTTKFSADFRASLVGFGVPEAPLQWKVDGEPQSGGGAVKLDTKGDEPKTLSNVVFKTGGAHVVSATLAGGDRLAIDDTRWLVTQVASELKVLIVEGERGMGGKDGSGAFLQMALSPPSASAQPGTAKTDSYVSTESISALELSGKVLSEYGAVMMTDVGQITASQADRLAAYVKAGGTVIWFMGEQVSADNYNQMLVPRKLMPGVLAKRMAKGADQPGYRFDFKPRAITEPLLKIFENQEKSGLDTAQVFTYWQMVLPSPTTARTVLSYLPEGGATTEGAKGDPAITTHTLGNGRVVFYSTTAGPEWTSFPAKPAWLTLMHEMLAGSVIAGDDWLNRVIGQSLEVPATVQFTGQPQLFDPAKKAMVLEPAPVGSPISFKSEALTRPGVYTIVASGKSIPVAVNVPGDEADIRTIDNNAIKSALGGIEMDLYEDVLPAESVASSEGNDFGWTVMMIVLCMAALECFLAMQFGHTRRAVVKA